MLFAESPISMTKVRKLSKNHDCFAEKVAKSRYFPLFTFGMVEIRRIYINIPHWIWRFSFCIFMQDDE